MHDEKVEQLFKQIFDQFYPGIFRKLNALLMDYAAAEDLAQETFLRLYRNPPDHLEAVGTWLHRVSANLAYDYLKRKKREASQLSREYCQAKTALEVEPAPDESLMRRLNQEEVQEWLKVLPERDRQVLWLRYSGYSYFEIAERLQVRQPLVGNLIRRALIKLQRQVNDRFSESISKEG
mgnify:CR=1 FL=1